MARPPYFILLTTVPLILLGGLITWVLPLNHRSSFYEDLLIGLILGTLFGQTTMSAAWTAFGPGPLLVRLPLALLWIVFLLCALALGINESIEQRIGAATLMTLSLAVQWCVLQLPLLGVALFCSVRLRHFTEVVPDTAPRAQFGIRQLMIFTGLIGLLLGLPRLAISAGWFPQLLDLRSHHELRIFLFVTAISIAMTLPLVLAVFLKRFAIVATTAALALCVVIWLLEDLLMVKTIGQSLGPVGAVLIWLALFTNAWVLVMSLAVRASGYRFGPARDGSPANLQ